MASSTRPLTVALVSHPGMHACGGRERRRCGLLRAGTGVGWARWGRGGGAVRITGAGFVSLQQRFFPRRETGSQAWTDGQTKTNIAQKNIHALFFLVIGDD